MILAGDIGGTKTLLASLEVHNGNQFKLDGEIQVFPSKQYPSFQAIVQKFKESYSKPIEHACFGMAGPNKDGKGEMTSLPQWPLIDARALAAELRLREVYLINDLEANAYGIGALQPEDFVVLQAGSPEAKGNAAVISAGTGLGEAGLYWDGSQSIPFACEGGHTDFAPRNELEIDLLRFLTKKFGHVSYERILSGPGFLNVFNFLRETNRAKVPPELEKELQVPDTQKPAVISDAGMKKRHDICVQALDIFVSLYGAEAGNLALKIMARGGVYVGGGIAPQILSKIQSGGFMKQFLDKGRMGEKLLPNFPVKIIKNPNTALLGAGRCAALKGGLIKS
jgi:glucokinase